MTSSITSYRPRHRPISSGRAMPAEPSGFMRSYIEAADAAVAAPFVGVTVDGQARPHLFPIEPTGVSTRPIMDAVTAFLASLSEDERAAARFPLDTDMWQRWSNIHAYTMRHGAGLDAMTEKQRERALAVLRVTMSAEGFATARDVMRLNEAIADITGRPEEYGEWLYWLSVMGEPSPDAPWGWQIDGHHLIVNALVLGDQLVMSPVFLGSEPVSVDFGPFAGTRVFEAEEQQGLAMMRALDSEQRAAALLGPTPPREVFGTGFQDNAVVPAEGLAFGSLSPAQQERLLTLIGVYAGRIRPGHAEVKMAEIRRHLSETRFAWMGGWHDDSVFYYRIYSPVVLIEFDHLPGIALDNDEPSRDHIHTVVRTPNGNDYGKDLLRQHYAQHDHA